MADDVIEAARAYADGALELVAARCPAEGDVDQPFGFQRWVEVESPTQFGIFRRFELVPSGWSALQVCAARELADLQSADEYQALVNALTNHPVIGSRIGTEAVGGAGLGGSAWTPGGLITTLVDRLTEGGAKPPAEAVAKTIMEWHQYLCRPDETVFMYGLLSDISAPDAAVPLAREVALDELTSEEIGASVMLGAWTGGPWYVPAVHPPINPSLMVSLKVFGLRTSFTVPVVYDATHEQITTTLVKRRTAMAALIQALLDLRLFKAGRVGLNGVVTLLRDMSGQMQPIQAIRGIPPQRLRVPPYQLDAAEAPNLTQFSQVRASAPVMRHKVLNTACRRFGFAADRSQADDEIVDLIIAAESLFLADTGKGAERGEMTFRLSTRAALFAHGTGDDRRRVLRFMRDAYNARSSIVHSGTLDESELKGLDGVSATPAEFTDQLEDVVRSALQKALEITSSGKPFPPDWNDLMFPHERGEAGDPIDA